MAHISMTSPPAGLSELSKQQLRLTSIYEASWQDKTFIYVDGQKLKLAQVAQLCYEADELRFSCKTFLINDEALLIKASGFLSEKEWQVWWGGLSAWCADEQNQCKALILDFGEVRWITYRTRQSLEEYILRSPGCWGRTYFILTDLLKTIYQIQKRKNPKDYAFVDLCQHIPNALRYIFSIPNRDSASLSPKPTQPSTPVDSLKDITSYTKEELYLKLQHALYHETSPADEAPKQEITMSSHPTPIGEEFDDLMHATRILQEDIMAVVRRFNSLNKSLEKQSEARIRALAEKEANLTAVVENMSDMILSVDRELRVLVINTRAKDQIERRFGVTLRRGDLLPNVFAPKQLEQWYPYMIQALEGRRIRRPYSEKDQETGAIHYYEFSLNPIYDVDQQPTGVSIFAKDVTETHLYQREIEEKEQLLSSINKSIKEGIFRTIPGKGIVYINRAFVEMFGYESEAEMKQIDIDELYVNPSRRNDFLDINNTYFVNEEVHFRRKDGSTFWGLISSIKSIAEDGSIYQDGAVRDITELKETKAQLVDQNEELIKVNKELDSFVYRTSHDLRAPLVSTKGLIDVMQLAQTEEERLKYMDLMRRSIDKLDGFIRDIIGYSRNSRSSVKRSPIDFRYEIEGVFESLYYLENGKQIQPTISLQGDDILYSDPVRVGIILSNLISNAIQYSDLKKETPQVSVEVELKPEGAWLMVQDNGIGIKPVHQQRIFEMFYRGTQHGQGSGIGLYIVKETVEKLKGTIEVASVEGAGTTFRVWIPQVEPEASQTE